MAYDSSLPDFPSTSTFESYPTLYRTTSAFASSRPMMCTAREADEFYFSSADKKQSGATQVIAENNVSPALVKQMLAFLDSNGDGQKQETEKGLYTYVIKLFVSKDDSYLRVAYEKTAPAADEVCIFLEDNSTDLFSGKTSYIKIGSKFQEDLVKRKQIGAIEEKFAENYQIVSNEAGEEFRLDFSGEEINELIRTGKIENVASTFFIGILQLLNIQAIILAPVYDGIGSFILFITKKLREYLKFEETDWDPEASIKTENGQEKENTEFEPALIPIPVKKLEALAEGGQEALKFVTEKLRQELAANKKEFDKRMASLMQSNLAAYPGAQTALGMMQKFADMEMLLCEKMIAACESIMPFFMKLGERWIYIVNAFFCGLWNSLLEAVLGIADIVGYLFKALGMAGSAAANAQTLIPQSLEIIDEMIQAISSIDFGPIFSTAIDELFKQLSQLDLSAWASSISLEKVAYFLGGLIGFVIQILASIYYSGGIDGVRAAIEKLGAMGKGMVDFIKASIEKIVGIAAGFSMEGLVKIITKIVETLKAGAKAVVELIRYVFTLLKRGFRTLEEMYALIKEMLKLTSEDEAIMKKLGLQFTSLVGDTATLCKTVS